MKKTLNKKSARRKRKVMSPEERLRKKEQRDQMKEIRDIMFRIGFTRLSGIDGKEFVLSLIHISEPTRPRLISYAVFCLKKKKK